MFKEQFLPNMAEWLTEELRETPGDCLVEASLDREQALVRNVALLGPESRNGYRYTTEAMQQAVSLYDGRPVFVDHAEEVSGQLPVVSGNGQRTTDNGHLRRSIRDYAGQVVSPRFESGRVRGDVRLVGANTGWLLDLIEAAPRDIGMSHVVVARRRPDGHEVERIERVVSVDIVAFPATVQSFAEAQTHGLPPVGVENPAAAAAERGCRACPFRTPAPQRQQQVQQLVEHSRLPTLGRTATLDQLLLRCPEPERLIALLESWWQQLLSDTPRSAERTAPDPTWPAPHARRALVAAVRGD